MAELTMHQCGPSTGKCVCLCVEGGPCEHDFTGGEDILDENGRVMGWTAVCSRCGMSAMSHDLWVAP